MISNTELFISPFLWDSERNWSRFEMQSQYFHYIDDKCNGPWIQQEPICSFADLAIIALPSVLNHDFLRYICRVQPVSMDTTWRVTTTDQ